jgi:hypothetical protein
MVVTLSLIELFVVAKNTLGGEGTASLKKHNYRWV